MARSSTSRRAASRAAVLLLPSAILVGAVAEVTAQEAQHQPGWWVRLTAPRWGFEDCDSYAESLRRFDEQMSQSHSQCLSQAAGKNCRSDAETGCSCVDCARWHGSAPRDGLNRCREEEREAARRERERKASEEAEKSRREAARRQAESEERPAASEPKERSTRVRESDTADRRREALAREDEAMRERLVAESAWRAAASARSREQAKAAGARVEQGAAVAAASTGSLVDKLVAMARLDAPGPAQASFDLSALAEAPASGGGAGEALSAGNGVLDAGKSLVPMAGIPLEMVRHVLTEQVRLIDTVTTAIGNFERLDARFVEQDLVTEFGERAFSPRAFLGIVAGASLGGYADHKVEETVREPLRESLAYRAQAAIDQRRLGAVYEPYVPPAPDPQVRHWWSYRPDPQRGDILKDSAGVPRLFKAGEPFGYDPHTQRNTFTREQLEDLVATQDYEIRRSNPGRWHYEAVVFTPIRGEPGWVARRGASWAVEILEDGLRSGLEAPGGSDGKR